jgi:hypothetical protein
MWECRFVVGVRELEQRRREVAVCLGRRDLSEASVVRVVA